MGIAVGDVRAADVALLDSAERSRLVLALRAILELSPHPEERRPGGAPPTRPAAAWNLLSAAQRADPAAVEAVFHDPAVAAWAFQLVRQLAHGVVPPAGASPYAAATLLGSVAAAAAIRAGTRCSLRVPVRGGRLWLPSLGLTAAVGRGEWALVGIECGPSGTVVYGDSGSLRMPHDLAAPSEGWSPLPALGVAGPRGTPAVLDHLSPHRDFRAVHDPLDLSRAEVRDWRAVLHATYEMLRTTDPAAYRAVTGAVRSVVPLEDAGGQRVISASVPDAYGAVMTSFSRDIPAMAATFVHEARHQLLTALGDLTPLFVPLREGPEPVYFAPWRNDPRPLRGLLYGAHAFAGVTAFWLRRRAADGPRAEFEFALHRWQVRTALAALGGATGLTAAGGRVVAALAESAAPWWTEAVPALPARLVELCCRDASALWRARNLTVADADVDRLAWLWRVGMPPARPAPGRPPQHGSAGLRGRRSPDRPGPAAARRPPRLRPGTGRARRRGGGPVGHDGGHGRGRRAGERGPGGGAAPLPPVRPRRRHLCRHRPGPGVARRGAGGAPGTRPGAPHRAVPAWRTPAGGRGAGRMARLPAAPPGGQTPSRSMSQLARLRFSASSVAWCEAP
ncbi:HEXXH motif-containing putative peptide modification protein [Streptomyces sp. SS7]|uniref:aKG-HExxH-type peptide beta-hydroxylase n=1 Tax=Streptomyces sp. SS7 TaxID=3108485 RepID=UPI0030EBA4B3